jgi:sialidase-1
MRNSPTHTDRPRRRGVCVSDDGGATFDQLRNDTALIEPGCQGSILRYSWPEDGRSRILFANPASGTERVRMTVRLSYDEGQTWPVVKEIFDRFSCYSSLLTLPSGRIGLLYEAGDHHRYERIDFATFDLNWLTDGQDHPEAKP